jgi:putative ABC transport system permease protein
VAEAGLLALGGVLLGIVLTIGLLAAAKPIIAAKLGMEIALHAPGLTELWVLSLIVVAGIATGLVPAWRAYSNSLGDGLQIRT